MRVHSNPIAPSTTGASRCGAGSVNLSASGTPAGGSYQWYTGATGNNAIAGATGATYQTPSLSTTTTYYVAIVNACGTGPRASVTATINPVPSAPTTTGAFRCGSGSLTLSASGTTAGNYRWYTTPSGGIAISGATGSTYQTPTLSTTTTYYVTIRNSNGCESSRIPVTATIENITAPVTTGASRTGPGSLALSATGAPAEGTYNWYATATGGSPLATGQSIFITPVLTSSTTYYVSSVSNRGCGESARTPVTATILPVTQTGNLTSHVILYHENFSGYSNGQTVIGMTTQTSTVSGTSYPHWDLLPTNASPTVTAGKASGGHYLRTAAATTNTGLFIERTLTLNNEITTTGYDHIGIIWSQRQTYASNDSNKPKLFYSINNGSTWTEVSDWTNTPSTSWAMVNNSAYILLPTNAANASNVQFRWVLPNSPVSSDQYFALDDITIIGTPRVGLDRFSWSSRPNGENPFTRSVSNPDDYTVEGLALKWSIATHGTTINNSLSYITSTQFQSTPSLSLVQTGANATNNRSIITLEMSSPVEDLTFSMFDVDTELGQFRDDLEVVGYNGTTPVYLPKNNIITTHKNEYTDGKLMGVAGFRDTGSNLPDANITVTFPRAVDRVVITYRNTDATRNSNGQQGIGIHDIMWRTLTVIPLPVELISFTASLQNNEALLQWATASELNNDRFEIERSTDGKSFTRIGTVQGKGTSSLLNKYSFTDRNPAAGKNYYRLKQVDTDGPFEYSKVVLVQAKEFLTQIKAYPNPMVDYLTVTVSTDKVGVAQLTLLDMQGRTLLNKQLQLEGRYTEEKLDLKHLAPGVYFLKIKGNEFDSTTKLMK